MRTREVIITVDTVLALLRDYCGEGEIPQDAKAHKLWANNPQFPGMLGLQVSSPEWSEDATLMVNFHIKRFHGGPGGGS